MQRHLKTAEAGRRRKERCARGSFICTCVYLYGNVQDELESQNTLLLAENTVFAVLFFIALGGFHRPSTRSAITLSFVFHLPRVGACRRAFQVWQVPLLLFSFSCFLSRPASLASCGFGQPVSERHLGRIGPMNWESRGSWKVSEACSSSYEM